MVKITTFLIFCLLALQSRAAIRVAASANLSDVQNAYNLAANGDTIQIPAGTVTWPSGFAVTKAVTFEGAGASSTIIRFTIGQSQYLFDVTGGSGVRFTGITLDGQGNGGAIRFRNANSFNRFDHGAIRNTGFTTIQSNYGRGIYFIGYKVYGLVDNNVFTNNATHMEVNGADTFSWNDPIGLGTTSCVTTEGNQFINNTSRISHFEAAFYNSNGARHLFRNNTVNINDPNEGQFWDSHGNNQLGYTTSTSRGTIWTVIENNILNLGKPATGGKMVYIRGGIIIATGNTVTNDGTGWLWNVTEEECWYPPALGCRPNYPAQDQVTNSWVWNNTLNGSTGGQANIWIGFDPGCGGNFYVWGTVIQMGRDIFQSAPPAYNPTANFAASGPSHGYTPLVYPHPAASGGGPGPTPTPPSDTTAPTLTSATINNLGTTLTLAFSEPVNLTTSGGLAMTMTGGAITPSNLSGTGSSLWTFATLSRVPASNETGSVTYTQPGNGIEDLAGNDLATVTVSITNNSTQGAVARPEITLPGGPYYGAQTTTITCATVGSSIYYTLDGSVPSSGSTLYSGAITIPLGAATTIRAIGIKSGSTSSPIAQADYEVNRWTSSGAAFKSVQINHETGTFTYSFDVTPSATNPYFILMFGPDPFDESTDMAISIWFTNVGTIEARNGAVYAHVNVINPIGGTTYKVTVTGNLATRTYSATVDGIVLATNYAFRTEQTAATDIDYVGFYTANGSTLIVPSSPSTVAPVGEVNATNLTIGAANSQFGVMTHFAQFDSSSVWPMITGAGIDNIRDEHYWASVEPTTPGTFTYPSKFTNFMTAAAANNVKPLMVLDWGNALYETSHGQFTAPYTPAGRDGYSAYALELLNHYPDLQAVEVWNEYNASTFIQGPATANKSQFYFDMLKDVYETIKPTHPGVTVIAGATVPAAHGFFNSIFALGAMAYLDAVSIHPYTTVTSVGIDVTELRELIKSYNGGVAKPIWATEFSLSTTSDAERPAGAIYLAQFATTLLSVGVEKMFYYLMIDQGSFLFRGLVGVSPTFTPNPVWDAYRILISRLKGWTYADRYSLSAGTYAYRFQRYGVNRVAMWSAYPMVANINTASPLTVTDINGAETIMTPVSGVVELPVTESIQYLDGTITSITEKTNTLAADSLSGYSKTQGTNGWSYGYLAPPYNSANFTPMTWGIWQSDNYRWLGLTTFSFMSDLIMHPDSRWTVRRWTSTYAGTVTLSGAISRGSSGGDGVTANIIVDGTTVYTQTLSPSQSVTYNVPGITLTVGSKVDFCVDQIANNTSDATSFTAKILKG